MSISAETVGVGHFKSDISSIGFIRKISTYIGTDLIANDASLIKTTVARSSPWRVLQVRRADALLVSAVKQATSASKSSTRMASRRVKSTNFGPMEIVLISSTGCSRPRHRSLPTLVLSFPTQGATRYMYFSFGLAVLTRFHQKHGIGC